MKITSLEEYGLRCMMQLALSATENPMTGAQVAEKEGLTPEYAGKLLNMLGQRELVRSVRGRNGGFVLARDPDQITVAEIVGALSNDIFDSEYCDRHVGAGEVCVHETACSLRPVWSTLSEMIRLTLESVSLQDLMRSEGQVCNDLEPRISDMSSRASNSLRGGAQPLHQVEISEAT